MRELLSNEQESQYTRNIVHFINSKLRNQPANEQLYLLFTDFKIIEDKKILKSSMGRLSEQPGCWYAIFYLNIEDEYFPIQDSTQSNRCLFVSNFNNEEPVIRKHLDDVIALFDQSLFKIQFKVADTTPVKPNRNYKLISHILGDTIQTRFTITYELDLMQNYFLTINLQTAQSLLKSKRFIAALDTLSWAKRIFPDNKFKNFADTVLYAWAGYTLDQKDGQQIPQIFEHAENHWGLSSNTNSIYAKLKIKLLKLYYSYLERSKDSLNSRIKICEKILKLDPKDKKYQFNLSFLKGKKEFNKHNYWTAAQFYSDARTIDRAHQVARKKLIQSVSHAFQHEFSASNYSYLYKAGKKYLPIINSLSNKNEKFKRRYQFAFTRYKIKRYTEAKIDYEWLLTHWKNNQSFADYNDTFEALQELYVRSMEFDKAFSLLQETFRMKTGQEDLLQLMVTNMRASYLVPILDVFQYLWGQSITQQGRKQMFQEADIIPRPKFVTGLYLVNRSGKITFLAGSKDKIQAPNITTLKSLTDFPAPWSNKKNSRNWLVSKLNDGYVILEMSNNFTQAETIHLQNIQRKKMEDRPWHDLSILEQDLSLPYLSRLLTTIIGRDYAMDSQVSLNLYMKNLLKSDVQYLVIHDAKGKIAFSEKFNRDQGQYNAADWQKSSHTMALYRQNISYANTKIIDIANPIFVDKTFRGVLRIGFKKQ